MVLIAFFLPITCHFVPFFSLSYLPRCLPLTIVSDSWRLSMLSVWVWMRGMTVINARVCQPLHSNKGKVKLPILRMQMLVLASNDRRLIMKKRLAVPPPLLMMMVLLNLVIGLNKPWCIKAFLFFSVLIHSLTSHTTNQSQVRVRVRACDYNLAYMLNLH